MQRLPETTDTGIRGETAVDTIGHFLCGIGMRHLKGFICSAIIVLAFPACEAPAEEIRKIGVYDLSLQRLQGQDTIVVEGSSGLSEQLVILVTIDVDGRVIEAETVDNYFKLDPKPALAAVRQWKFRPQIFDDRIHQL